MWSWSEARPVEARRELSALLGAHDLGALAGEKLRRGLADARGGPGNDDDLVPDRDASFVFSQVDEAGESGLSLASARSYSSATSMVTSNGPLWRANTSGSPSKVPSETTPGQDEASCP